MAREMDRIVPLEDLEDFQVAEGEPDVRGWDVLGGDGRKLGEVDQLLIDTTAMKVRYLDVDVEDDLVESDQDRHILIPIGFARIDEDSDQVIVDNLDADRVRTFPVYDHGPVTRELEASVREAFGAGAAGERGAEFLEHEDFREARRAERMEGESETRIPLAEEELEIRKCEVEAGEVDIETHVETEHVSRPVTRYHDEVEIERRPVREARGEEADFREEQVRIPLRDEEVIVEKEPVVKEELVVRRRPVEETEDVEADLRRERADIERHGRIYRKDGESEEERQTGR